MWRPKGAGRCSFAQPAETGPSRSLDVATPPFTAPAFGLSRNVVEQAPSCRLRRHRSLLRPSRTPRFRPFAPESAPRLFVMAAPTGHLFRRAVIFGHFCWLGGQFFPSGRHFRPFLLAWRSIFSIRPPFLPIFAGSAVVFVRQAIIFGLFCRFDGRFLPSGRHFCPFLLARWMSWPAPTGHLCRQAIIFGGHFCLPGGGCGRAI